MDESESDNSLYLTVVSETARVPTVMERVAGFARRQGVWDCDGLLLVVRELLMNAIVHGNDSSPDRMALIRVARRGGVFEIQVDDEGEGFDFESLVLGLPEDPQTLTNRGLVLVHELSVALFFERGGRRVRAVVDPEARLPNDQSHYSFVAEHTNREAICTSPMAKSL